MSKVWQVSCDECGESAEFEVEDAAVGWMFGHGMRTGHDDITKKEINGN
jgi:hypothetical protein